MSKSSEEEMVESHSNHNEDESYEGLPVRLPKDFDYTKRRVPSVNYPATEKLTYSQLCDPETNILNFEIVKNHLQREGRFTLQAATTLIQKATEILSEEDTLLDLDTPLTVCGDIHGQFFDLIKLFEVGGHPKDVKYLFLGDYVDRGNFGIECLLLLYAIKIQYPDQIYMIRGNHECAQLTEHFTFKQECIVKYSEEIYFDCIESFQALPLAALMNKQFLCVHGGISPEMESLDDIRNIDRFKETPSHGIMCDILWSDPSDSYGESRESFGEPFILNRQRGCSFSYTFSAVTNFLRNNGLICLIRAHEVQNEGFKLYRNWDISSTSNNDTNDNSNEDQQSQPSEFPSLISLFSAPKYSRYTNKAAILQYDEGKLNIESFTENDQPYWLPDFLDVFTWSIPFVAEKVSEMVVQVLSICSEEELKEQVTEEEVTQYEGFKNALQEMKQATDKIKETRSEMEKERIGDFVGMNKEKIDLNPNMMGGK